MPTTEVPWAEIALFIVVALLLLATFSPWRWWAKRRKVR
jgi:hypothetical protein